MKRKYFKKLGIAFAGLLSLSLISTAIVSCTQKNGSNLHSSKAKYTIMPTYPSQADNLIALGIAPDYYPTQMYWKYKRPFPYMDARSNYFVNFIYNKKDFASSLKNKLLELQKQIKNFNTSWWSFSGNAYNEGVAEEFWDNNNGSFVLYDRYLIDNSHFERDNKKLVAEGGPITDSNSAFPVDFKLSRDVFLSIKKDDVLNFEKDQSTPLRKGLKEGLSYKDDSKTQLNPLYNFSYFAKKLKDNFLEANKNIGYDFENSIFNTIIFNNNNIPLFYSENNWEEENSLNSKIFKVIEKVVLTNDAKSSGLESLNYNEKKLLNESISKLQHHPIYEQNLRLDGGTQIYLGTMRDSLLYLYDIAFAATSYSKTQKAKDDLKDNPSKLKQMQNALLNAEKIATNLVERIQNMRKFFQAIGFVDKEYDPQNKKFDNTLSKSIGLLTTSIDNGTSTLQSQSKYGFLYYDLGFKAPKPITKTEAWEELIQKVDGDDNKCHVHPDGTKHCFNHYDENKDDINFTNSILNMDDNGWWWNLGAGKLNQTNFAKFNSQFDIILNMDYANIDISKRDQTQKNLIESLLKPDLKYQDRVFEQDYKLWNDGIKSPIGYNQILDAVLSVIVSLANKDLVSQNQELFNKANDWGDYWKEFIK